MEEFYKEEEIANAAARSIEAAKLLAPIFQELELHSYQDFLRVINDPKYKDIKEIVDKIRSRVQDNGVSREEFSSEVTRQRKLRKRRGGQS
jgi:hypothetical protein